MSFTGDPQSGPPRLSIGCGPEVRPPWHHSDIRWWPGMQSDPDPSIQTWDHIGPIVLADGSGGLPWDDLTFAGAVGHHFLQALPYPELVPALIELRRVLVYGGTLRLSVPDVLGAFEAYERAMASHFVVADDLEPTLDGKFCLYLSQSGATRSVFTVAWLVDLCGRAGFSEVEPSAHGVTKLGPDWITELDNRPEESLYVECRR